MQFYVLNILYIFKSIKSTRRRVKTMALMLAMFQKMRLIREKNQLVLEQTQASSKLKRVEKSIERVQKRYTSLFAQLDSQAKMMQSQAKVGIQNMFGLGSNSVDVFSSYSGLSSFVLNNAMGLCANGASLGKDLPKHSMDSAKFQELYQIYMQNGGTFPTETETGSDGNTTTKQSLNDYFNKNLPVYQNNVTPQDVQLFNMALQAAKDNQQKAQFCAQQMSSQYDGNVSIWLEAQKAELEAQQDAALEPLNYEQTMWELEKEQKDMRLKRIEEEINSYKSLCDNEIKNTTPTFGLG